MPTPQISVGTPVRGGAALTRGTRQSADTPLGVHWRLYNMDEVTLRLSGAGPNLGTNVEQLVASDTAPNGWAFASSADGQTAFSDLNAGVSLTYTLTPPPGAHVAVYGLDVWMDLTFGADGPVYYFSQRPQPNPDVPDGFLEHTQVWAYAFTSFGLTPGLLRLTRGVSSIGYVTLSLLPASGGTVSHGLPPNPGQPTSAYAQTVRWDDFPFSVTPLGAAAAYYGRGRGILITGGVNRDALRGGGLTGPLTVGIGDPTPFGTYQFLISPGPDPDPYNRLAAAPLNPLLLPGSQTLTVIYGPGVPAPPPPPPPPPKFGEGDMAQDVTDGRIYVVGSDGANLTAQVRLGWRGLAGSPARSNTVNSGAAKAADGAARPGLDPALWLAGEAGLWRVCYRRPSDGRVVVADSADGLLTLGDEMALFTEAGGVPRPLIDTSTGVTYVFAAFPNAKDQTLQDIRVLRLDAQKVPLKWADGTGEKVIVSGTAAAGRPEAVQNRADGEQTLLLLHGDRRWAGTQGGETWTEITA